MVFISFMSCQNSSDEINTPLLTNEEADQTENDVTEAIEQMELYSYPIAHTYVANASQISQIKNLIDDILAENHKVSKQEIVEGQTIHIKIIYESGRESEYRIIANMYLEHSGYSYYISEKNSEQIDQLIGNLIN